jgi:hypothetical protein
MSQHGWSCAPGSVRDWAAVLVRLGSDNLSLLSANCKLLAGFV